MSTTSSFKRRPLGKATDVSSQKAQAFGASEGSRRDSGVEPKQIRDRSRIAGLASWTNRRLILDQQQQVVPRRRRDGDPQRTEKLRQQRVQHKVRELSVIRRDVRAELVF